MVEKLTPSQTSFVTGQGITVNQLRLVDRVKLRTDNPLHRRAVSGLFIGFSSAYNTILHSKLFHRLREALNDDEIQLIKALYFRTRFKLDNESFTLNIGVAQGSAISTALFNIYYQDLYDKLKEEGGVDTEDLLGYADDLLVLCTLLTQLKKVISIIKSWSEENNLELNSKKSDIIEFAPK